MLCSRQTFSTAPALVSFLYYLERPLGPQALQQHLYYIIPHLNPDSTCNNNTTTTLIISPPLSLPTLLQLYNMGSSTNVLWPTKRWKAQVYRSLSCFRKVLFTTLTALLTQTKSPISLAVLVPQARTRAMVYHGHPRRPPPARLPR